MHERAGTLWQVWAGQACQECILHSQGLPSSLNSLSARIPEVPVIKGTSGFHDCLCHRCRCSTRPNWALSGLCCVSSSPVQAQIGLCGQLPDEALGVRKGDLHDTPCKLKLTRILSCDRGMYRRTRASRAGTVDTVTGVPWHHDSGACASMILHSCLRADTKG